MRGRLLERGRESRSLSRLTGARIKQADAVTSRIRMPPNRLHLQFSDYSSQKLNRLDLTTASQVPFDKHQPKGNYKQLAGTEFCELGNLFQFICNKLVP